MDQKEARRVELISVRSDNVRQRHTIINLKHINVMLNEKIKEKNERIKELELQINEMKAQRYNKSLFTKK